jgi:hypothetical protein
MAKNRSVFTIVVVWFLAVFVFATPSNTTDKYLDREAHVHSEDLQFYQQTRPGRLLFASCNEDRRSLCSFICPPYTYEVLFESKCFEAYRELLRPICNRLMARYKEEIEAPESDNELEIKNEQVQAACSHDLPLVCPEIIPPYTVENVLDAKCLKEHSHLVSEKCNKLYSFYQIYNKSKIGRLVWHHPYLASVGSLCIILAGIVAVGLIVRRRRRNNHDYLPEYNLTEEEVDSEELVQFPSTDLPAYSKDDPHPAAVGQEDAEQEDERDDTDLHSSPPTQLNGYHAVAIDEEDSDES